VVNGATIMPAVEANGATMAAIMVVIMVEANGATMVETMAETITVEASGTTTTITAEITVEITVAITMVEMNGAITMPINRANLNRTTLGAETMTILPTTTPPMNLLLNNPLPMPGDNLTDLFYLNCYWNFFTLKCNVLIIIY